MLSETQVAEDQAHNGRGQTRQEQRRLAREADRFTAESTDTDIADPPTETQPVQDPAPSTDVQLIEAIQAELQNLSAKIGEQAEDPDVRAVNDLTTRLRVHPLQLTRQKVAIVGFTEHRVQAFTLGDDFEIWGINELYRYHDVKLFHRWFEIHERGLFEKEDPEHLKSLATFDIPVYMQAMYEDIPASLPFPKEYIEQKLGRIPTGWSKYFTSTPAWEIGLAIVMGAKEIHLYGIDMAQETEYFQQRACVEYWLGVAHGMGIKTYIPPTSDIGKSIGQYAFGETGTEFALKLNSRIKFLHEQDNQLLATIRALDAEYQNKKSSLQQQFTMNNDGLDREYREKREPLLQERNKCVGAIEDCEYWRTRWAVIQSNSPGPTPDRSADPRTGIQAA